jgi:hypothetical protein
VIVRRIEQQEHPADREADDAKSLYRLTLVPDDGEEAYLELPNDKAALEEARRAVSDKVFEGSDEKATIGKKVQVARPDGSVVGIATVKE